MKKNSMVYRADGAVLMELPAAVWDQVYVVSARKRKVYVNRVAEYMICSRLTKNNMVKVVYEDPNGIERETWWHLSAFGRILFTDRDEAYRKMEELWDGMV